MTKSYDIYESERVQINMNLLGHEGPHIVQTLTSNEQEICKNNAGLYSICTVKFEYQHNETII